MPNLNDIMEMAELLDSKAVSVVPDRCVAVRNRNASCQKCLDACLADGALELGMNSLTFNSSFCVSCGACTVVCPTEALIPTKPFDQEIHEALGDVITRTEGAAVFACARISSHGQGNPEKYIEVPCLGRLDESVLVDAVAQGAREVFLVDGNCQTCKYRYTDQGTENTLDATNTLFEAWGIPVCVQRYSQWPFCAQLCENDRLALGQARRDFFLRGKERAKAGVQSTITKALKGEQKDLSLRDRFRVASDGALPRFDAKRRSTTLASLFALGTHFAQAGKDKQDIPRAEETPQAEVFTRLWGRVEIDAAACSGCRMCTVFCPTGALTLSSEVPTQENMQAIGGSSIDETGGLATPGQFLSFEASQCVQCNSCADICMHKCLEVSPVVSLEELASESPRLIAIPAMVRNALLGKESRLDHLRQ